MPQPALLSPFLLRPVSQLLDCFVIPVVILLSWFFLLVRYKAVHFLGIVVCILGMGCMVGADVLVGRHQGAGESGSQGFWAGEVPTRRVRRYATRAQEAGSPSCALPHVFCARKTGVQAELVFLR